MDYILSMSILVNELYIVNELSLPMNIIPLFVWDVKLAFMFNCSEGILITEFAHPLIFVTIMISMIIDHLNKFLPNG